MTVAAINASQRYRVFVTFDIGVFMTGEATVVGVHRLLEFLLIDIQTHGLAVPFS